MALEKRLAGKKPGDGIQPGFILSRGLALLCVDKCNLIVIYENTSWNWINWGWQR